MEDKKGNWWEEYQPQDDSTDVLLQEIEAQDRRKRKTIFAIVVIAIAIAMAGGAYILIQIQEDNETIESQEETTEVIDEIITSEVFLTVTAQDITENKSATVTVTEIFEDDTESGKTVLDNISTTIGEEIALGQFEQGKYLAVAKDASNESAAPAFAMFEVDGSGETVSVIISLSESTTEEQVDENTKDENVNIANTNESTQANDGIIYQSTVETHTHNWVAITQTVHHDAVYRTVNHAAVCKRITVCDTCGSDITDKYASHKASTGHSSYHYENKTVKEAYTEKVLVSAAYDETVTTGYKCSTCGATK